MKKRIKEHIPNQSLRKLSKETPKLFSSIIIFSLKKKNLSLSLQSLEFFFNYMWNTGTNIDRNGIKVKRKRVNSQLLVSNQLLVTEISLPYFYFEI